MMATSSRENHKEHALHNEKVYHFLKQKEEFIDWRVTTSFYSSLHFIEFKLFPLTTMFAGKKETFKTIEEFRNFYGEKSKHAARIRAVKEHLKSCRTEYKELFDLSMTSRYRHYKFNNPKIIDTKIDRCLTRIKKICTT